MDRLAQVPQAEIQRSSFDRSHSLKTTLDAGFLVPVFLDEALPGDTFNLKMHALGRLATPIFPVMDNIYLDSHFFAVPHRLIWENWDKFCGAQDNPADTTDYVIPTVSLNASNLLAQTLGDYFGIRINQTVGPVNALPFRAYNLIFNEWFRDQNLQNSVPNNRGDGPDLAANYTLLRRGKRHDYFTSCLPWPQKGPAVNLPLGSFANVVSDASQPGGLGQPYFQTTSATQARATNSSGFPRAFDLTNDLPNGIIRWGTETGLVADLSTATAATINALRQAFQIQRLYERDARGGTRLTEIIKSHFGVSSPDGRLQRPEYLGGGSTPLNVNPVYSSVQSATPLGQPGAVATVGLNGSRHGFTASFTEHCIIIGLVSIRADMTYQQGVPRMFDRRTRFDYYWPALAHIGEQAVLRREIFATGNPTNDNAVFGYQERYAEYRYKPSQITGKFRSEDPTPLDAWHLGFEFLNAPTLNSVFIQEDPPIDRVIAVPSEPHMLLDCYFEFRAARPMPTYGVPGMVDHF